MKSLHAERLNKPLVSLFGAVILWKCLLLFLAVASPGSGYDTSTDIFLNFSSTNSSLLKRLVLKLTRWDAIYFVSAAQRGYRFEQEWAFGWGFSKLVALVAQQLTRFSKIGGFDDEYGQALSAILIANVSHLASVFVLYKLTRTIWPGPRAKHFAFISAVLHIISPGGLFLSAPYAESSFSLFSFMGYLLYAKGLQNAGTIPGDVQVIMAGAVFGASATLRSNGLLNGVIFVIDVVLLLRKSLMQGPSLGVLRRILSLIAGGILVGVGFVIPQAIAWREYCSEEQSLHQNLQPWCSRIMPSIYSWVQSRYWNVGFFKYWTLSNIPLFLLAIPALSIMIVSAIDMISQSHFPIVEQSKADSKEDGLSSTQENSVADMIPWRFALPQLILALLATTNYHVQIITRISSGHVVWYWWIASNLDSAKTTKMFGVDMVLSKWVIRWMVIYAMVQAALFASFLPPA